MNYVEIYSKTRFTISTDDGEKDFNYLTIPIGAPFDDSFVIITAYNPMNIKHSHGQNEEFNKVLYDVLYERKHQFYSAIGYLDEHEEESYCVFDIGFDEAIELGKYFRQYSIFYKGTKMAGYYDVDTGEAILDIKL